MPLYMDIHTVDSESLSVEDVVKAHMEDLAIQDRFGVKQLKYWVNEEAKTLFCLMKGPDKEACHQVHKQSHGNTACNIIEVSDNEYNLFMGVGTEIHDLAHTPSGELDTGYRTILLTNFIHFSNKRKYYTDQIQEIIKHHNGVLTLEPYNELMVSFIYASDAIMCANSIKNLLSTSLDKIEFNLAISSGRPVDEYGKIFFEETKLNVQSLCSLGITNKLFLDIESKMLSEKEIQSVNVKYKNFKIVDENEINFSIELSKILKDNLLNTEYKSNNLITSLGLSKSQAYRKIKSLTGFAPNQLFQESRLQKALNSIAKKNKTVAETAFESGFNSPTYFSRTFKKRFDISPTEYINI